VKWLQSPSGGSYVRLVQPYFWVTRKEPTMRGEPGGLISPWTGLPKIIAGTSRRRTHLDPASAARVRGTSDRARGGTSHGADIRVF
jgi:hypothetical protein